MFTSMQSNGIISVTQQLLKRSSRKALRQCPPFTSITGRIPSGPELFPSRVFLRAWSSSCSSIGRRIDSMTESWSMPSAMVESASVGWLSKSLKCSTICPLSCQGQPGARHLWTSLDERFWILDYKQRLERHRSLCGSSHESTALLLHTKRGLWSKVVERASKSVK